MLKGKAGLELRKQDPAVLRGKGRAGKAAPQDLSDVDMALFEALRARRRELAHDQSVPAYVIFPDRSLAEMSRVKPTTLAALGGVHGVGQAKLVQYGDEFLGVIRAYLDGERPAG